jgi:threonine/homoserine/homoserine lactone efflux protein
MALGAAFTFAFLTALSGALMPGPLLTVTIAQSAKMGFKASVLLMIGHSLLELIMVTAIWFGVGHILKMRPVLGTITAVGGLMLFWMGWGMVSDVRKGAIDLDTVASDSNRPANKPATSSLILAGAAVSLSNPYWTIWWATIGLTIFATLSRNLFSVIVALYLGHISGDFVWYMAVGGAVASGRRLITRKFYNAVVVVCGIFLLFLGSSFLYALASGKIWAVSQAMHLMKK